MRDKRAYLVCRRRRRVFAVVDDGTGTDDLPDWLVVAVHEHVTRRGVGPRAAGVVQAQQLQEVTRPHRTSALCVKPDVTSSNRNVCVMHVHTRTCIMSDEIGVRARTCPTEDTEDTHLSHSRHAPVPQLAELHVIDIQL